MKTKLIGNGEKGDQGVCASDEGISGLDQSVKKTLETEGEE